MLHPLGFALALATGLAQAQTPTTAAEGHSSFRDWKPFEVVDANGKLAGRLYEPQVVQIAVGAKSYLLILELVPRSTIAMTYSQAVMWLYFTSTDCTGPAFLPYGANGGPVAGAPSAVTTVDPSSGQILLYPAKADIQTITTGSIRTVADGTCSPYVSSFDFISLMDPVDITTLYKPPFRVK